MVDDFVELDPVPGQSRGHDGLRSKTRSSFPDMHRVIEEMIGEGDKVCTRFAWTGTQRGPFLGVLATGRRIAVKGVVIDRLSAGEMADRQLSPAQSALLQRRQ